MKHKKANYSKDEIFDILRAEFIHAESDRQTYANDYSNAWRYYRGLLPKDTMDTGLDPVCTVRERVDENFQILKSIFTGSDNSVVRVKSRHIDAGKAEKLTDALNSVVVDMNEFPRKLESWIKEALLYGISYAKVEMRDHLLDETNIDFEEWEQEQLDSVQKLLELNGYNDVTVDIKSTITKRPTKAERQEAAKIGIERKSIKLFTGVIKAIAHDIFPSIEYIPFSDMYASALTRYSMDEAPYVCHKYMLSVNDGLLNGWNKDVMMAGTDYDMSDPSFATTGLNVGQQWNQYDVTSSGITPIPETNNFPVFEHYIKIAYKGKLPKIWKFTTTQHDFLQDPEEVEEMPFIAARVMEIPNSFYGLGLYHTEKRSQDLLTLTDRMTAYTANQNALGRWTALKDSYDPESLTDARKGGVVEIYEPNAVEVLPVADISGAMQFMREGILQNYQQESSDLGGAQNASKMARTGALGISSIINKQEQAPRSMAATFTDTGLIPLYRKVFKICRKAKFPLTALSADNFADFPKEIGLSFDVSTTSDKQAIAQGLIQIRETAQNMAGGTPKYFNDETDYNMFKYSIQAITGQTDVDGIIIDPSTVKPSPFEINAAEKAYKSKILAIEAAGVGAELDNEYKLAQIRKENSSTTLNLAQAEKFNADKKIELDAAGLENADTMLDIMTKSEELNEKPKRFALEATEVQSSIIAEQANILNDQYAMGANVNVQ